MFSGLFTALITPFHKGEIDYKSLSNIIKFQIDSGVHGLVILGSTGESMTISDNQREELLKIAIKEAKSHNSSIPIIVGTGSNSTIKTLEYTQQAKKLGADAALIVCPYYNKPSEQGMYEHFKFINDNVDLPIIIYNVPSRSVVNISDQTIAQLSKLRNIIGIKDSTGDLTRPLNLSTLLDENQNFSQISGEDATAVAFNLNGGCGVISVVGNIIPKAFAQIQNLTFSGKYIDAVKEIRKYNKLIKLMFCETNPIPVKYAAFKMGLIFSPEMRLPLLSLTDENRKHIDKEIANLGLI